MKVIVLIPTMLKNSAYLQLCVESLLRTTDWGIIVCENGAPFEDAPTFSDDSRVGYMHEPRQGQCLAVNQLSAVVPPDTDYLMISNDDMYYAPDWDYNLRFDYPCFSPNLIEPVNNAGSAPPFLKLDAGLTLGEFNQNEVDSMVHKWVQPPIEKREETGFNFPLFIKLDLWNMIGGYDVGYDPWGSNSDTDLQTKIELAGVQPMRLRDVLVYHFSNKGGTFDGTHQEDWWKNWRYYESKWGFTRDDEPLPDTWYARNLVNKDMNVFRPEWEGKYK